MRLHHCRTVAAASVFLAVSPGVPCADTLGEAVALAYQTNPTLQAQRASEKVIDEEYPQAAAGLRPTISASTSVARDANQLGLIGPTTLTDSFGGVTVSQPIYTGGRVATAIDAANADILAGREALRATEISVLQGVVGAYVDVRRDQARLQIAADAVTALSRQLEEAQARFDVGQVTRTDVAQAEARQALARAQWVQAQATLAITRAAYAAVVGQNPGDLAPEPPIAQLLPASIDAAFDTAEHNNPQLLGAEYGEAATAARLAQAKAETRPQLTLNGSLGFTGGEVSQLLVQPNNPFANYTRDLRLSVDATMPIFTGGKVSSQIRQAAARDSVGRIQIEVARRAMLQSVSQAWNQLLGARGSLAADEVQVKADTIAYQGAQEEHNAGLRTTLDVLNAQQELENSQLALVGAQHDEYAASAAVLAAIGSLDVGALAPGTARYDPAANLNKVRHAVGWVPWDAPLQALDHLGAPTPTPAGQRAKP